MLGDAGWRALEITWEGPATGDAPNLREITGVVRRFTVSGGLCRLAELGSPMCRSEQTDPSTRTP